MISPKEIRKQILDISKESGNPHIPSSLSTVEILSAIYGRITSNDSFVLSKGHGCMAWYAILRDIGYNPPLKSHPDICSNEGILCTTGSLGHGLPIAVGMALAKKILCLYGVVYVLMGDGECQEGTTWESIAVAVQYNLDNLIVIVDNNGLQAMDLVHNVDSLDLYDKFLYFGCMMRCVDGHDIPMINDSLRGKRFAPYVIIADTVKGKGISFMENKPEFHAKQLTDEQYIQAYEELDVA